MSNVQIGEENSPEVVRMVQSALQDEKRLTQTQHLYS